MPNNNKLENILAKNPFQLVYSPFTWYIPAENNCMFALVGPNLIMLSIAPLNSSQ